MSDTSRWVSLHSPRNDVEVVVDTATGAPTIMHWGRPITAGSNRGRVADADAIGSALADALDTPLVEGRPDVVAPLSVVPEHYAGYSGSPGLHGRRGGGRAWAPHFATTGWRVDPDTDALVVDAADDVAQLGLRTTITLEDVLEVAVTITNTAGRRYSLDQLTVTLPVPAHADELLTMSGRWAREFQPHRAQWCDGTRVGECRYGRTSHAVPSFVATGPAGFGEWHGEVWSAHLAWSGNHVWRAERLADGRRLLQLGELLHPGEVVLEPGESYTTPTVVAAYSEHGVTPLSWCYHRRLRRRDAHPRRARPVLLNTWEAVYFDHDADRLDALAAAASDVGVERFVLDDGWFGSRRNDHSGLGDWVVSSEQYPDGLTPLIARVRELGMEFGIWVEPEMINRDSDLYRAHPDWVLATPGYDPPLGRNQLVLDLDRADTWQYLFDHLHALLSDHDISFVKWDMNRDHIQGSGVGGSAGSHAQTIAVYRLIDELRARHPDVEFESCSGGGGRVDHGILHRTQRVWTSDCNDALERQTIQRGLSLFVPPELMGAHIGPERSHTTGRVHGLAFRATTAMFGHLGLELDVASLSHSERNRLRDLIDLYRHHRALLHHGDAVRFDTEEAYVAHGVYAADRRVGIVSFAQVATAPQLLPPPLRLPGLDADQVYRVEHLPVPGERWGAARGVPTWLVDGAELTGRQLATVGVQLPALHPETAVLLSLTSVEP